MISLLKIIIICVDRVLTTFFEWGFYTRLLCKYTTKASNIFENLGLAEVLTPGKMVVLKNAFINSFISIHIGSLVSISTFLLLSSPVWFFDITPVDVITFWENFKINSLFKIPTPTPSQLEVLEINKTHLQEKTELYKNLEEYSSASENASKKSKFLKILYFSVIVGGAVGLTIFMGTQISLDASSINTLIKHLFK